MLDALLPGVLRAYPAFCQPARIEPLGSAGGFSGARFWRLATPSGILCLKCWPEEPPSPDQLRWIHTVLTEAVRRGFTLVPRPIGTVSGETLVECGGRLWEMAPWLPGKPERTYPLLGPRLVAAMEALGRFHQAVAEGPASDSLGGPAAFAPSPALQQRHKQLLQLLADKRHYLTTTARWEVWPEGAGTARRMLQLFPLLAPSVLSMLERAVVLSSRLQPCLRDIWSDHVLYCGDAVSGIVDFGAMKVDTVAGDVARLLGSYVGDESAGWQSGLAAYQQVRPLSAVEQIQMEAFDRTAVLMSGMNWIEWIYCQRRVFADLSAVLLRLERLLARMQHQARQQGVG